MPIDQIEIPGTSFSMKIWKSRVDDLAQLFRKIRDEADEFSLQPECPGFHDCELNEQCQIIRGFFTAIVPFETEHLVDGISSKTTFKRIESTEFLLSPDALYTWGKNGPARGLTTQLSSLTGYAVSLREFEFHQLRQLSERLSVLKTIGLKNAKDKEVRRVRLAGAIENYLEYNCIDPTNHDIESVAGLVDSPLGPMTLTVGRRGAIRIGVKRGFILTHDCLNWLIALILEENPPAFPQNTGESLAEGK